MAWAWVAVSAAAEVASGDLTLNEPAGVQSGDLLVAFIAYRDSAAFALPSGWNLVATQQSSGNVTTTGSGSISSGVMAYIVRGASTPNLTFTRTLGDVAVGRIAAYRPTNMPSYVAGSANTQPAGVTQVVTPEITTTGANQLLVAGASLCRGPATCSNFDAATDPATDSGANAGQTADPIAGTWQERAETNTTTGADVTCAIGDAVRATAGATGQLECTASAGARHVLIVGAFEEVVAPSTIVGRGLLRSKLLHPRRLVA